MRYGEVRQGEVWLSEVEFGLELPSGRIRVWYAVVGWGMMWLGPVRWGTAFGQALR